MCIVFYTVNPEPATFPKSFIVRIFRDDEDCTQCLKTINFPISSPDHLFLVQNVANEYGRLYVSGIMSKENFQ